VLCAGKIQLTVPVYVMNILPYEYPRVMCVNLLICSVFSIVDNWK